MENGKHFIVIRELAITNSDPNNLTTQEFNLADIKKTLGEKIGIVDTKIDFDKNTSKVYLILTCKKNIINSEQSTQTKPLVNIYPNPNYKDE